MHGAHGAAAPARAESPASPPMNHRMTPLERRSTLALASIYALRMLGLFLIMPVIALEAARYPGGGDPALVGMAMGIYGLLQALLQIPLGVASDRWGRKPVVIAGLGVFALGSAVAAAAPTMGWLILGRALQGAGAVSAAVSAMLADLTREAVRTKAMAAVGMSIALMFALSLLLAPVLTPRIGLAGLFALTGVLALLGMAAVAWLVPPVPRTPPAEGASAPVAAGPGDPGSGLRAVLRVRELQRVDLGVFVLHAVQIAMWMAVPALLVQAGLPSSAHWQAYLPAVALSIALIGALLFRLERRGHLRAVYLGSIALIALVQAGFLWSHAAPSLPLVVALLSLYFLGFNVHEALQPSLVSRYAPAAQRGAALGVFNTLMSLGIFAGGLAGGAVARLAGQSGIFVLGGGLSLLWLALAWPMRAPAPRGQNDGQ